LPETLSLFDPPEPELKLFLAQRLQHLASVNKLFIGASSWKYQGWLGQIYSRERYLTQGRFSKKRFDQDCLTEYAETFPIVSGDFAFYQFPTRDFWRKLFTQIPPPFQFAFKVPEELTLPVFPRHARYAARAGRINDSFLSVELLQREFLDLLRPYANRVSLLIFEFPASAGRAFATTEAFAEALSRFFAALPKDFRYAVEIRDRQLLEPAYFRALREHGVAHVFNSWTDMPAIQQQASASEAFTANFTAVRGLLTPGRLYEESLRLFSPYDSVREPNAEVRSALRNLLIRSKNRAEPLFMFINNRLEGFAPGTIAAVIEGL
jgi:uncharacterized protein YecE (DUF72 family)